MIILRDKKFSVPRPGETLEAKNPQLPAQGGDQGEKPLTSKDLLLEQMKLQRQQISINHQRQQMRAKEEMTKMRQITQLQKMESEEKQSDQKDQIRTRQQESIGQKPDNTGLYKQKAKTVAPVGMPKK